MRSPVIYFPSTDSTANLTGQNSLETQVINQCSRSIVKDVIGKVVSPMTAIIGNDLTLTQGQPTSGTENIKFVHRNNNDTQSAFIDQSAYNFLSSVSKSNGKESNETR